jgi:S-adenosylmethionine decarboxylase
LIEDNCLDALGTHLLLDLKECDPDMLDDIARIKRGMIDAAERAGATIVGESFHKFSPLGVTGIIAIAESHLCIHTWPEHRYAAVDIFSCGSAFRPREAADLIVELLQCEQPVTTELRRGVIASVTVAGT